MRNTTRKAFAVRPGPRFLDALREAAGDAFDVEVVDGWDVAAVRASDATYGSVVIIPDLEPPDEVAMRRLGARVPDVPLIGVLNRDEMPDARLFTLFRAGCAEVIVCPDELAPTALRERLARAMPDEILEVAAELSAGLSSRSRELLRLASRIGTESGYPSDLRRALRASPTTVLRWFEEAGLPTPREILLYVRMLAAAHMIESPTRSIAEVARAAGYSGGSPFRRAIKEVAGHAPRELRRVGARRQMRQAVLERLAAASRKDDSKRPTSSNV